MFSKRYSMAAVEVLDILEHMDEAEVSKVPTKFVQILKSNASTDYKPNIDYTKRLYEMDLIDESKTILGVLYRHYWCPEEERKEYEKNFSDDEKAFRAIMSRKDSTNSIFDDSYTKYNSKEDESNIHPEALAEIEETNFFKKIWNKFVSIFNKKDKSICK